MKNPPRRLFSSDSIYLAVVLLPIILMIALFIYYPAVDTFGQSLTNRNLRIRRPPKPVGLANYVKLVEDDEFWEVTGRSFTVVIITLPLEMIVAFGIAMLLNQRFPGRGVVRTLTFLPWMLPGVVNGFLWGWLLNGEYGALNGFLYQFGFIQEYQYWLREPAHLIFWVTVVQTWTRYAFPTIILLAGLQSIPDDLYDAAKVDGASGLSRARFITIPLLLPSFGIALVVEFIAAFQIFDVIWTLTAGGSVGGSMNPFTKTLMLYNYELVFRDLRVGLGAALSYIILLMSLAVGLIFVLRVYNQGVQEA
ncbi:MAG: sugar ABC transporter permease [Chloroflexota bacterium]|nr:sugar ABC transporter permease [Chloroflexota bacterium]MDE2908595.1 sugar ABC transporter permease [Chloroflexota bacterium]